MYEMCQTWFWHYPKSVIYCDSSAQPDLNKLFGIESYNASEFDDEPILTKPDAIAGMRYSDYLNTIPWTDELKSQLQEELVYNPHSTRCVGTHRTVSYPEIKEEYVEEDVCKGGDSSANMVKIFSFSAFFILFLTMLNNL